MIQALIVNRFDEALSVWIAVRALRRDGDTRDPTAGKEQLPLLREQRITIVHQELRAPKKSFVGIHKIAEDLEHPCFVRIDPNATDVDDTR